MAEVWGVALAGAAITAGASIYAGDKAAGASQRGTDASIGEQARQYDQTRADFAGQRSVGNSALGDIASIYGWAPPAQAGANERANAPMLVGDTELPAGTTFKEVGKGWYDVNFGGQRIGYLRPGGSNGKFVNDTGADISSLWAQQAQTQQGTAQPGAPSMERFFTSPDYQFNLQQGQQAIDRSLAARGRALSGAGVKEGERFAAGVASGEFNNYMNRLFTAAGIGNAATQSTAAAGQNMANNNSAALLNNANNRASMYGQTAAGVNNAVQGGISNYMLQQYLNKPVK